MGVEDLVVHSAEEYVHKAVQVATDREYCEYATQRIAAASDVLFDDLDAVREHERFFDEAAKVSEDVKHSW
jgi:predicted O-linked N-acetylglucosamine transferase (SPINDLY family)